MSNPQQTTKSLWSKFRDPFFVFFAVFFALVVHDVFLYHAVQAVVYKKLNDFQEVMSASNVMPPLTLPSSRPAAQPISTPEPEPYVPKHGALQPTGIENIPASIRGNVLEFINASKTTLTDCPDEVRDTEDDFATVICGTTAMPTGLWQSLVDMTETQYSMNEVLGNGGTTLKVASPWKNKGGTLNKVYGFVKNGQLAGGLSVSRGPRVVLFHVFDERG